jgi:hypothetical protein
VLSRRQFLQTGFAAAGSISRTPSGDQFAAHPLAREIRQVRTAQNVHQAWRPTGLARNDYLRAIESVVRAFIQDQDASGIIVDRYERRERQYATPAFACAAATVGRARRDENLIQRAVRAMHASCEALAAGTAADRHPDFYTVMLMHADRVLAPVAHSGDRTRWRKTLATIDARRIYRYQPTDERLNNWNLVAASGEWMRHRAELAPDATWVEASLDRQMEKFTEHGLYRDPDDPLAYDHFARYYIVNLLEEGYEGRHAARLRELMDRAAWTSLLMQSPHGELPCGGRSAHHQWNEAEQAMTFEAAARRARRAGDRAAAGAFKRAARLSLQSVLRWTRPSGDLWVLKNRIDPGKRHGYERYSFHSQYNLLAVAKLAVAYAHADDRIDERPAAADTGGFAFALEPAFHKIFANAGGAYVEIDTRADARYNPTGVLRLHHPAVGSPLPFSDGVTAKNAYQLPSTPGRSLALGPAWRDDAGEWHALADHDRDTLEDADLNIVSASPQRVEIEVRYRGKLRGGATSVREHIVLAHDRVEIAHHVDGNVTSVRQQWPLLVSDGSRQMSIEVAGRRAMVMHADLGRVTFDAAGDGPVATRLGVSEPFRNGWLDAAVVDAPPGTPLRCDITFGRTT